MIASAWFRMEGLREGGGGLGAPTEPPLLVATVTTPTAIHVTP